MAAVSDGAARDPVPTLPLVWRIPPWQPAALIVVATVLLALVLYGHFSAGPVLMMVVVAVAALVSAGLALRLLFVADDDGLWIRRSTSQQLVEWHDIASIDMVPVRGNTVTVRITRRNGSFADVPPTLLLPTMPTGIAKVRSRVHAVALRLTAIAADQRR